MQQNGKYPQGRNIPRFCPVFSIRRMAISDEKEAYFR